MTLIRNRAQHVEMDVVIGRLDRPLDEVGHIEDFLVVEMIKVVLPLRYNCNILSPKHTWSRLRVSSLIGP